MTLPPEAVLFVLAASTGSHDDEQTWIAGIYTDRAKADELAEIKGVEAVEWEESFKAHRANPENVRHPGPPPRDMTYYWVTEVPFGKFGKYFL